MMRHPLRRIGTPAAAPAAVILLALAAVGACPASAGPPGALERPTDPRTLRVPVAVFGSDDRVAVPANKEWVAQRIGLLFNNQSRTVCSAFCVADNVIATAAHCLVRGAQGQAPRYSDYNFVRNYDRSRTFARIEGAANGAGSQHVMSGDFKLRVRPPIDAAYDWALARVPRNTCPADSLKVQVLGADELIAQAQAGRIFQISYHRDWAQWRPAYSKPCSIAREFGSVKWQAIAPDFMKAEQMVLHTCDTGGASSGSPLLMQTTEGGAVVVAINVGTYVQSKIATQNGQVALRQRSETIANTAVNAAAFATRIETLRTASILASAAQIRELQELLRGRGHFTAKSDGTYGPALKTAIEAYERVAGEPVTGLATQALVQRLTQDAQRAAQPGPAVGPGPPPR